MRMSDISYDEIRNLAIGTVESVSPAEIRVLLDINAPQNTSLNTGEPTLFPKINGYVLIPNEAGALVCIISWMGIEHSSFPKRQGFKDFDLIDLPFPLRKMTVNPLGIIKKGLDEKYSIERGVYSYPSIGDTVIIPTRKQLESIVENREKNACIKIGISPLAANAPVFVDPDRLFGRHIAVLGNTGSGKSCSVAGLIRWSLEEVNKKIQQLKQDDGRKDIIKINKPNARFIVLDPNGEYSKAFDDFSPRKYRVILGKSEAGWSQLRVPAWMWNSYEWSAITQARAGAQRPLLRQALRVLRGGASSSGENENILVRRLLTTNSVLINKAKNTGEYKSEATKFGYLLRSIAEDIKNIVLPEDKKQQQDKTSETIEAILRKCHNTFPKGDKVVEYYTAFEKSDVDDIVAEINKLIELVGGFIEYKGPDEDTPIYFKGDDLPNYLERLAQEQNAQQFLDFLIMRIRTILSDTRMSSIVGTKDDVKLLKWLEEYIGKENADNGQLTIIDLSIVPSDIVHIVVSVIARIIFEALQRYRRQKENVLPTVIVMEEAHNFISRYNYEVEEISPSRMCSQTFERIAKEGRKFGLGLILSSQRPSELSPTVLSQCNTFLLHRIVNDRDQEMVGKLVPDNLGKILNELPTLPTKKAILLGWAAPVPILVEMNELIKEHRPHSEDPDFWDVWTGQAGRKIDWSSVVSEWQKDYQTDKQ